MSLCRNLANFLNSWYLVVSQAKMIGGDAADVSKIGVSQPEKSWKEQAGEVVAAMADWLHIDFNFHCSHQPLFQEFLTVCCFFCSLSWVSDCHL